MCLSSACRCHAQLIFSWPATILHLCDLNCMIQRQRVFNETRLRLFGNIVASDSCGIMFKPQQQPTHCCDLGLDNFQCFHGCCVSLSALPAWPQCAFVLVGLCFGAFAHFEVPNSNVSYAFVQQAATLRLCILIHQLLLLQYIFPVQYICWLWKSHAVRLGSINCKLEFLKYTMSHS